MKDETSKHYQTRKKKAYSGFETSMSPIILQDLVFEKISGQILQFPG